MSHPSARIRGQTSGDLAGKRIVLGIAGSIAAVKCVELARELIRHGADVLPVMTPAATRILHPDAMRFATGHAPITALSGDVEHVRELGIDGDADLLLIAPATANTIAKLALGIDDTALTTFASVALGAKRPVLLAPAMHAVMEENPATRHHMDTLKEMGVRVVRPLYEEGKAKLAPIDHIVAETRRAAGPHSLAGRTILIVTGAGKEPIDPVRHITNASSGRTGRALVAEAWRRGADVVVFQTDPDEQHLPGVAVHRHEGVRDLLKGLDAVVPKVRPDAILVPAALADYAPVPAATKIASDAEERDLRLHRLPKVLPHCRGLAKDAYIVGWKLQDTLEDATTKARERLDAHGLDLVIANARDAMGADAVTAALVSAEGLQHHEGTKDALARAVLDRVEAALHDR